MDIFIITINIIAISSNSVICNSSNSICFLCRFSFASASPDNIKQWKFPDGNFVQNLIGHNSIVNCMAVNSDGVLVSGGEWSLESLFIHIF